MKTTDNRIPLLQAGYREKVFAKAITAQRGGISAWPRILRIRTYDPYTDYIEGIGRVRWEGTDSKRILEQHGLTDTDCLS